MIRCVIEGDRVMSRTHLRSHRYEVREGQRVVDLDQDWPARNGEPLRKREVHYNGRRVVSGSPAPTLKEKIAAIRGEYDIWLLLEDDNLLKEYQQRVAEARQEA